MEIALSLTPVPMDRGDEGFCVLNAEGVDARYVAALHAGAFQ
jgi:hypothetical protein